jgi:protein-disulfide isomerase
MDEHNEKKFGVPGAIVIGAVIIGLAIVFTFGSRGTVGTGSTADTNARPTIEEAAKKVGVNQKDLAACIAEDRHAEKIKGHMDNAQAIGFQGTPHSVVISHTTDKKITVSGAQPIENLRALIETIDTDAVTADPNDLAFNVTLQQPGDHVRGSQNPTITIIEYSDIDCPFCSRFHSTMKQLLAENENIQWIYRHTPIAGLHPEAYTKALATECVYELSGQNDETFWKYIDLLFGVK